jgi:hypothetical protein
MNRKCSCVNGSYGCFQRHKLWQYQCLECGASWTEPMHPVSFVGALTAEERETMLKNFNDSVAAIGDGPRWTESDMDQ